LGYRYPVQTIRYEGDPETPFAGLWVEVKQVRTGSEIRALLGNRFQVDQNAVMAPYILGWNLVGLVEITETLPATDTMPEREIVRLEEQELPFPCDHPEILRVLGADELAWIHGKLLSSVSWSPGGDDPKDSTSPSKSTPDGEPTETPSESQSTESQPKPRRIRGS